MGTNPFQPPDASTSTLGEASYVYRPLRFLTVVVGIALFCDVLFLAGSATTTLLLSERDPGVFAGEEPTDGTSMALLIGLALSGLGYLFTYIGGGILFCAWLVRASKNARALGARGMEFTPGWTAGWFFVPVLNLFRPYAAVKELYQASDPESGSTDWGAFEPPGFIFAWWVSWIAFIFAGAMAQNFVTAAVAAISAVLAFRVIVSIERRQLEKKARGPVLPTTDVILGSTSNRFL